MTKKGFVISWFFPPGNSSEGLVTYKLLKNSRFDYDVWTKEVSDNDIWNRHTDERQLISKNINIINSAANNEEEWTAMALSYFIQHRSEYSFIMSRAMPPVSHVVASKIKKIYPDIFWIASFGDPLVNTPYVDCPRKCENPFLLKNLSCPQTARVCKKIIWNKERRNNYLLTKNYKKINDTTFKNANLLLFNNDFQFRHAFTNENSKYSKKGIILPHSFDDTMYSHNTKKENRKIVFNYTGHLDKLRSPNCLFRAIKKLKDADRSLYEKVEFNFYGHMDDIDKIFILDNDMLDLVKIHNNINYFDSIKKMECADWNLIIDANLYGKMNEYIFFPAKLVDYFGSMRPIFAITQPIGATSKIIRKAQNGVVTTHDPDDIAMYLRMIIYNKYTIKKINSTQIKKFDARIVARSFDTIIMKDIS